MPTHWTTCNDLTIDECQVGFILFGFVVVFKIFYFFFFFFSFKVDQSFTQAVYYYLYCTIDSFRPCETEKECLASGRCSDEEETKDQYFNNTNLRYYFQFVLSSLLLPFLFLNHLPFPFPDMVVVLLQESKELQTKKNLFVIGPKMKMKIIMLVAIIWL